MDLQCQLDMPMIKSKVFDNHSDDRMDKISKKSIENVKEILNFKQKKKLWLLKNQNHTLIQKLFIYITKV